MAPAPGTPAGEPAQAEAPSSPPAIAHVQVIAVEYRFTLSRTTVPAGEVIFDFVNHGQDEHNLNARAGEEAAPIAKGTAAGSYSDVKVQMRAGTYTLFCSLPEHEAKGMHAVLTAQ